MSIINWLLGRSSTEAKPGMTQDDKERMIHRLQAENEQLRYQESMNMANREEINRLYREINALKASKPEQLSRLTYDELIEEARKRRLEEQARSVKTTQPQPTTSFQQRLSSPTRSSRRTSYPSHSDSPSMLPTYVALAAMNSSNAAAASTSSRECDTSSSSSSYDSSSSSSDSGSSSCDSGGGF